MQNDVLSFSVPSLVRSVPWVDNLSHVSNVRRFEIQGWAKSICPVDDFSRFLLRVGDRDHLLAVDIVNGGDVLWDAYFRGSTSMS